VITNADIKKYLSQVVFSHEESIEIIRKYIFDRKGVDILIDKVPRTMTDVQLCHYFREDALNYYAKKNL